MLENRRFRVISISKTSAFATLSDIIGPIVVPVTYTAVPRAQKSPQRVAPGEWTSPPGLLMRYPNDLARGLVRFVERRGACQHAIGQVRGKLQDDAGLLQSTL